MSPDHIAILAGLVIAFCLGWGLACGLLQASYRRAVRRDSENANRRDGMRAVVWCNGARKLDANVDELAAAAASGKPTHLTLTGQVSVWFKRGDA